MQFRCKNIPAVFQNGKCDSENLRVFSPISDTFLTIPTACRCEDELMQ
jgi:hypothetical protein